MPDYNIYIHSDSQTGTTNPTMAWKNNSPTLPFGGDDFNLDESTVDRLAAQGIQPNELSGYGKFALAKMSPYIAAFMVVAKVIDKVMTTASEYHTMLSGDARFQTGLNDAKSLMQEVLSPGSAAFQMFKLQTTIRLQNAKSEMQRELLGDSVINSYAGRGI